MIEIVTIFAFRETNRLLAFKFDDEEEDEFEKAFNNWQNPEYLEDFFEKNKKDLQSGFFGTITVEEAIQTTLSESADFENELYNLCQGAKLNLNNIVFKPLDNYATTLQLQQSKAYGPNYKSWLRIYAIRLGSTVFLITGSAIKLTQHISDREHTENELKKLKTAAEFLKNHGILNEDDFGYLEISD